MKLQLFLMFKIPVILFSVFIFVWVSGCSSPDKPRNSSVSDEFEGVITYHEVAKTKAGTTDDTVQLYYANGNYVGVHSSKLPNALFKDYYLAEKPLRLLVFNGSDTLQQLSLNFPDEKLDSFKLKKVNEKILSRDCESIDLAISTKEKDTTTYTDISFIFSRGFLKVDKDHFKNWNRGFFNKVVAESGAFYLKFKTVHFDSSHKNMLSSKTYDVISVKEEPVDPEMFVVDTTKIKYVQ